MKNIICGYVALLLPQHVGRCNGDTLIPVTRDGTIINYLGLDRDPWWSLDEAFYSGKLSNDLVSLRRTIQVSATPTYGPGVCVDISEARSLMFSALGSGAEDELVWIDNAPSDEPSMTAFLGYDIYVDGFGSLIRMGVFTISTVFEEFLLKLNSNGLFDNPDDLRAYSEAYIQRCENAGLEIIELRRVQDANIFRLYSVS
ncbi:hypothetical protein [Massilia sp. Root418]|uniref:hypothetical protein n=1 Tax=Massilia sp. Root418 TaxID=1736532 RepID=UPI0012F6FA74|nr:hypothetical protein [Massilia sp. Root418]